MWHEIHWNKFFSAYMLYVGTEDGYRIDRIYSYRLSAKLSARLHGYKFCN